MPDLDFATGLTLQALAYSTLLAGDEFADWLVGQPVGHPRDLAAPPVRVHRTNNAVYVTLSRSEYRNAFRAAMRDALFEALTAAEHDDTIRRITLAGDGPVLSSGGDLPEFGNTPDVVTAQKVRARRSIGALIAHLAAKTTVQLQGPCSGAGVELPAFAGRVVATRDTTFRLPEIAMGLVPGAGGTVGITHRVGRQRTVGLAILDEEITPDNTLQSGMVDEIACDHVGDKPARP